MSDLSVTGRGARGLLPATRRSAGVALTLLGLVATFLYDYLYVRVFLVGEWDPTGLDWLWLLAAALLFWYGMVPLLADRERARALVTKFTEDRLAAVAGGYLLGFALFGVFGPFLVGSPDLNPFFRLQPPLFATVPEEYIVRCAGRLADGVCHGTLKYPLGTNGTGVDMVQLLAAGARVSLAVALVTSVIVVPIGTLVGATTGYFGGLVDTIGMRYVEIQQAIPALLIYILAVVVYGKGLTLFVVTFGLFSWGGVAQVVRSETLQRAAEEFVEAAEGMGGSRWYVLRRHILPNVSNSAVPAVAQQVPALLLAEAAIAFLALNSLDVNSFGKVIAAGIDGRKYPVLAKWWVSTLAALFLGGAVIATKVVGDRVRDMVDPRGM